MSTYPSQTLLGAPRSLVRGSCILTPEVGLRLPDLQMEEDGLCEQPDPSLVVRIGGFFIDELFCCIISHHLYNGNLVIVTPYLHREDIR